MNEDEKKEYDEWLKNEYTPEQLEKAEKDNEELEAGWEDNDSVPDKVDWDAVSESPDPNKVDWDRDAVSDDAESPDPDTVDKDWYPSWYKK